MDEKINGSDGMIPEDIGTDNMKEPCCDSEMNKENDAPCSYDLSDVNGDASAWEAENANKTDAENEAAPEAESEIAAESSPDTACENAAESSEDASSESAPKSDPPAVYAYRWDYTSQAEHNEAEKKKTSGRGALVYAVVISSVFAVAFLMLALFVIFGGSVSPTITYNGTASVESVVAEQALPSTILVYAGNYGGSGFVISKDGYAVTNHHVIQSVIDDGKVEVEFYDGKRYDAKIVGYSENDDIAVLKIDGRGFTPVKIGSSADLVVGEDVVAIGNPGVTTYPFTVTGGVVSALNRGIKIFDSSNVYQRTVKAIQFSAAVNGGNSGGPLLDRNGKVIGIVSMKSTSSFEGIGFALPIDESMVIVNEIIKNGDAEGIDSPLSSGRPMLGITAVGVTANYWYVLTDTGIERIFEDDLGEHPDAFQTKHTGVLVTDVSAGTGAYGKLEAGDIILKIKGQSVDSVAAISYALIESKAGDTVEVIVARGEEILTVKIVLS